MMKIKNLILSSLFLLIFSMPSWGLERINRLGIGTSNQLMNDMRAISFKIQKSRSLSIGGLVGVNTDENSGGHGFGLKVYRMIFDEPQLNFYSSAMFGLINKKRLGADESGFQIDLTLGSEFSFQGLQSLGFSFEFGFSMDNVNDFKIQSAGYNFITAGLHFYI
jgi:hypothetical protein